MQWVLNSLEGIFKRASLADHEGEARVIVCFPATMAEFNASTSNRIIDELNTGLVGLGSCTERVQAPEVDQYYVYGSSLGQLVPAISQVCTARLGRRDAYLLCTDPARVVVDQRTDVEDASGP